MFLLLKKSSQYILHNLLYMYFSLHQFYYTCVFHSVHSIIHIFFILSILLYMYFFCSVHFRHFYFVVRDTKCLFIDLWIIIHRLWICLHNLYISLMCNCFIVDYAFSFISQYCLCIVKNLKFIGRRNIKGLKRIELVCYSWLMNIYEFQALLSVRDHQGEMLKFYWCPKFFDSLCGLFA